MDLEGLFVGFILGSILGIMYTYFILGRKKHQAIPKRSMIVPKEKPAAIKDEPVFSHDVDDIHIRLDDLETKK